VWVHCRFDGRDTCVEVNTTVTSAYDPPVQSHGHRRLAPRSAFDDHLVGVGLLNDLTVIHFDPCRIIRIATVLDICTTNGDSDNKTINALNSLLNTKQTDIIIAYINHVLTITIDAYHNIFLN
jgi:hypothetical protein